MLRRIFAEIVLFDIQNLRERYFPRTGGGVFGYVWDGVLGTPSQGATVQVRAVAALGPEVLSGVTNIQPNVFLGPQVLPGVAGSPVASALTSFSGRYEIPGLQPGTAASAHA